MHPVSKLSLLVFPLLTACSSSSNPPETTASADIGPAGGEVVSGDGLVCLAIPAGALGNSETITITQLANSEVSAELQALGPDQVYRFEPDGLTFSTPVELMFELDPPTATAGSITSEVAGVVSETANGLEAVASELIVTPTSRTLCASIEHFSNYATRSRGNGVSDARATVTFPTSLEEGEQGTVSLVFEENSNALFNFWTSTETDLVRDDSEFSGSQETTSYGITCASADQGSAVVKAHFVFSLISTSEVVTFNLDIACPSNPAPGLFTQPILVDLAPQGHARPEAISPNFAACGGDTFWAAVGQGAVLIDPFADPAVVKTSLTNGAGIDVQVINTGAFPLAAIQVNTVSGSLMLTADNESCEELPGAFLFDALGDIAPIGDGAGTVAPSAIFPRIFVTTTNDAGFLSDEISVPSALTTVVSNPAHDMFLGVTQGTRQFVLISRDGNAGTFEVVGDAGPSPRRMRHDPESGLFALSDDEADELILGYWDGGDGVMMIGSAPVAENPVGVAVSGNRAFVGGFDDDRFSVVTTDLEAFGITDVTTEDIPFESPKGPDEPLGCGHITITDEALIFSLNTADAIGFLPPFYETL